MDRAKQREIASNARQRIVANQDCQQFFATWKALLNLFDDVKKFAVWDQPVFRNVENSGSAFCKTLDFPKHQMSIPPSTPRTWPVT